MLGGAVLEFWVALDFLGRVVVTFVGKKALFDLMRSHHPDSGQHW